jgi:CBS domain-containing protein
MGSSLSAGRIGILLRLDAARDRPLTQGATMTIGEICNRDTVFTTRSSTIGEAARLMREQHVGDLVVVDERGSRRVPVGILTDRDLVVEILAKEIDMNSVTVGDVMSSELMTVGEGDGEYEAMQRMRAKGVRRVPVVDAGGSLVGIVSVDDFLDLLADELTALARLVSREQARERSRRT